MTGIALRPGSGEPIELRDSADQNVDRQQPGLRKALDREMRGGVYGRILSGGTIRIGTQVELAAT